MKRKIDVRIVPAIAIPLPLEERIALLPKMSPMKFRMKARKRLITVNTVLVSLVCELKNIINIDTMKNRNPNIANIKDTTACPSLSFDLVFISTFVVGL